MLGPSGARSYCRLVRLKAPGAIQGRVFVSGMQPCTEWNPSFADTRQPGSWNLPPHALIVRFANS